MSVCDVTHSLPEHVHWFKCSVQLCQLLQLKLLEIIIIARYINTTLDDGFDLKERVSLSLVQQATQNTDHQMTISKPITYQPHEDHVTLMLPFQTGTTERKELAIPCQLQP